MLPNCIRQIVHMNPRSSADDNEARLGSSASASASFERAFKVGGRMLRDRRSRARGWSSVGDRQSAAKQCINRIAYELVFPRNLEKDGDPSTSSGRRREGTGEGETRRSNDIGAQHRTTSPSQMINPTRSRICHKRPSSRYSHPWCPSQNQAFPSIPLMPRTSPVKLVFVIQKYHQTEANAEGNQ